MQQSGASQTVPLTPISWCYAHPFVPRSRRLPCWHACQPQKSWLLPSKIPCTQAAKICRTRIDIAQCQRTKPGHVWWCGTTRTWGAPAFQLYSGLLFGLPLAVTSFNRYSRFLDAVFRRLGLVMASMYFDDCNMVDWASSKGSAQWAACQLAEMLGTPFAPEKRQAMAPVGLS